jgi:hypothetical protein
MVIDTTTNWFDASWQPEGFDIPMFMNTVSLPSSYWSESTEQFIPIRNGIPDFLPGDRQQTGWPVHDWALNITNNLMYALIDNDTGRVLDFVNLGPFGSSLNIMETLTNLGEAPNMWTIVPANDVPTSPMSKGALNQIYETITYPGGLEFYESVLGEPGGYPATIGIFSSPIDLVQGGQLSPGPAYANFIQSCSWHASDPVVHYTFEDLTDPTSSEETSYLPFAGYNSALVNSMSNSVCTLGEINPDYNSGVPEDFSFGLADGSFQMGFSGAFDLPYQIWASTNLIDWSQIGTATQPFPGCFQFEDPAIGDYSTRFYQVRLP